MDKSQNRAVYMRKFRKENRDHINAWQRERYWKNPEKFRKQYQNWYANFLKKIRLEIIIKLGGKCVRCGFSDSRALQVDHINGGGGKERRLMSPATYWRKILKDSTGMYQLLCANCNVIKRFENGEN